MKIRIIPNVEDFGSISMSIYHREIVAALLRLVDPSDSVIDDAYANPKWLEKLCSPTGRKWLSRFNRWIAYPLRVAGGKADVFHILDQSHANLIIGLEKKKTVVTCHDIIPHLAMTGKISLPGQGGFTYPILISCLRQAAHIITVSESTKRGLVDELKMPAEKVTVVYPGVSRVFLDSDLRERAKDAVFVREKFGFPPESKIILHVGSPVSYKNTQAIIRALPILLNDDQLKESIYFLRLGADFFLDEKKLITDLGLSSRVLYGGRIPSDAELARFYRGADVFAFPSIWEGLGVPPLEAMACGLPVVASNAAALSEAVSDAGITVAPSDYAALAQGIKKILTDDVLWKTLSNKGFERSKLFTWDIAAQKTMAIYEAINSRR